MVKLARTGPRVRVFPDCSSPMGYLFSQVRSRINTSGLLNSPPGGPFLPRAPVNPQDLAIGILPRLACTRDGPASLNLLAETGGNAPCKQRASSLNCTVLRVTFEAVRRPAR